MPTNEVLAFTVTEAQLSSLLPLFQSQLHVDATDLELLTPTGAPAELTTNISHYCISQVSVLLYRLKVVYSCL